jgi:hypothetical protein
MTPTDRARVEEIEALIQRLENATGPDRGIDLDIARMLGVTVMRATGIPGQNEEYTYWEYTRVIDHALSLVPEAMDWEVKTAPHRKGAIARIVALETTFRAEATTPAIALVIAALKAIDQLRAASKEG